MNTALLENKFEKMGAKISLATMAPPRHSMFRRWAPAIDVRPSYTIDIVKNGKTERFKIEVRDDAWDKVALEVLDLDAAGRHLLLMARDASKPKPSKAKFLCGHDERFWFVAALPDNCPASTVRQAREALKPSVVLDSQRSKAIDRRDADTRKNKAFARQGEWYFVPEPDLAIDDAIALHDEPISRGRGSKPHRVEFLYRTGGTLVYASREAPNGLTESEYRRYLELNPKRHAIWQQFRRDPIVYAKGRVTHADHKTIVLPFWHRVVMNTEDKAASSINLVFLD